MVAAHPELGSPVRSCSVHRVSRRACMLSSRCVEKFRGPEICNEHFIRGTAEQDVARLEIRMYDAIAVKVAQAQTTLEADSLDDVIGQSACEADVLVQAAAVYKVQCDPWKGWLRALAQHPHER